MRTARHIRALVAGLAILAPALTSCGLPRLPELPEPGRDPALPDAPLSPPATDFDDDAIDASEIQAGIVAAYGSERLTAERDADSTRELSETMLRLHLSALPEGAELDRAAAPLQARGIPIVCNDVPPIR